MTTNYYVDVIIFPGAILFKQISNFIASLIGKYLFIMHFLQNIIYNIIYRVMVKVSKKQLKTVDIVEEK